MLANLSVTCFLHLTDDLTALLIYRAAHVL